MRRCCRPSPVAPDTLYGDDVRPKRFLGGVRLRAAESGRRDGDTFASHIPLESIVAEEALDLPNPLLELQLE